MLEAVQQFFQLDDSTARFLGSYVLGGAVLATLGWAWATWGPKHAAVVATRDPATERRERPAIIVFGIRVGRAFVNFVAGLPITPNQVTSVGLVLVVFNCALYAVSHNAFWFGSGLISALLFDTLDGLVARTQGTSSKFGGYLDAVIDRYQEILIFATIGAVTEQWPVVFLIVTGSLVTSYNKARVALEIETGNKEWPDLLEKPMRLFVLCVGLIGTPIIPWFLPVTLWMLAAMTHFTALQRFARAYFLMKDARAEEAARAEAGR